MIKKYSIEVDCANCAAKIENVIKGMDGINDATVNFISRKLTIDAEDEGFDARMKAIVKAAKRIEPDFEIEL